MDNSTGIQNDGQEWTLDSLSQSIRQLHEHLAAKAKHAINISLTLRNWLIGFYIAEYQLHGADRAKYGEKVVVTLAQILKGISNCSRQELYKYILFYKLYPQIVGTVYRQLPEHLIQLFPLPIVGTLSRQLNQKDYSSDNLVSKYYTELLFLLSYSHFDLLIDVENSTARSFYETECIRGCWSVRELKRQIGSMLYERTALSSNKRKMTQLANANAEHDTLAMTIRDPYVFDFIGLKAREIVSEKSLEDALIGKLQDFLLELGNGFCFEARQKRILIGDEYFQVDLVFYHRILKCHILIDLKDEPFSHENIGQLNSYVAYYAKHKMTEGDNPPIGILLCTQKNNELVEYALAGLNQKIFVSKYQLELPSKQDMEEFIRHNRAELEQGD
ncbi:MAG: DUF1016 family protein [Victivallales bacterium]|nr:DUF1016 family protein [Victivallales bacterium]